MNEAQILHGIEGKAGRLRLNRPSAIHALTPEMIAGMTATLTAWRDDPAIECIILDHATGRGFCSGGDIRLLSESARHDGSEGRAFFFAEYRLNHLMFTYAKPIVAFMDGITMGGGVGISQPARYRVATENTRFAMPESGIGLFPDVGGGWYLSRLPGRIGAFLATTGARLDGAECAAIGLATHYVPAERLDAVKAGIAEGGAAAIETWLAEAEGKPADARILANRERIDRLFASAQLEEILAALETDGSEWATKERTTLAGKSPQTCKVALRQLEESRKLDDFADNMRMEYRIASRVLMLPDFAEGVRAVIVDKDNAPRWHPARPEDVTEAMIDAIFAPLPPEEEWNPL